MTLGIIDVGTNSIHLLIGILGLNGKFHVILKERDLARLGEGGLSRGRLTSKAMHRAFETLQRYAETIQRCGVDHVEAVATSAVRGAKNGPAFVRRVRARLHLPLRIISGREEARLIYLGVLQAARFRRATVIVTIGGGSAQVIHGDGAHLRYAASMPLGGARLAQQFIHHDPTKPQELDALDAYVCRTWAPVIRAVRRHRWHRALGSSATIYQLIMAAYLRAHRRPPEDKDRLSVSQASLRRLVHWLASSSAEDRIQLPGLDPRREDLALPTGMALLRWMEGCGVRMLYSAPGSLREGLVMDYLIRDYVLKHRQRPRRIEDALADLFPANGSRDLAPGRDRLLKRMFAR